MSGLDEPTYVTGHGGNLYVVLRRGVIRVRHGGRLLARPFLDISRHVTTAGDEQGLLSMAFAPHFDRNHRVYVDFTNLNGDTRVVQYRTFAGNRNRVNPATKRVLLKVGQPFDNHNGGQLQIGPDGLLYISLGDGGSAGDPNLNGQSKGPLCDHPADRPDEAPPPRRDVRLRPAKPVAVLVRPEDRRHVDRRRRPGHAGRRSTTSATTRPRARTSGGASTRAAACSRRSRSTARSCGSRSPSTATSSPAPTTARSPAATSTAGARSRRLQGQYLYADFCSGRIWKIPSRGGRPTLTNMSFKASSISSFGQGSNGELYVVSLGGTIYKIVP